MVTPPTDLVKLLISGPHIQILAYLGRAAGEQPPQSLSVRDLARTLDLPIASTYRHVRDLEAADLIECSDAVPTPEGKRMRVYTTDVKEVSVYYGPETDFRVFMTVQRKGQPMLIMRLGDAAPAAE